MAQCKFRIESKIWITDVGLVFPILAGMQVHSVTTRIIYILLVVPLKEVTQTQVVNVFIAQLFAYTNLSKLLYRSGLPLLTWQFHMERGLWNETIQSINELANQITNY